MKTLVKVLKKLKLDYQLTVVENDWRISLFEDELQITKADYKKEEFADILLSIIGNEKFI